MTASHGSGGNICTPAGLRRFMMNLPESEVLGWQLCASPPLSPEIRLCLAVLVECVVSLRRRLPPFRHGDGAARRKRVRRLHAERERDLAWVGGEDPGERRYAFAHCAVAAHLVSGWDEDALRALCLRDLDTVDWAQGPGHRWHETLYAGNAGRTMEVTE